jgi:cation transport ATPase
LQGGRESWIALLAIAGIFLHLVVRYVVRSGPGISELPLYTTLVAGGVPLVVDLARKLIRRQFGSDLLAGISIVTSVLLGEYLVGCIVVLMLSGGVALEQYATRRASSVLDALARRMPQTAHRKEATSVVDQPDVSGQATQAASGWGAQGGNCQETRNFVAVGHQGEALQPCADSGRGKLGGRPGLC